MWNSKFPTITISATCWIIGFHAQSLGPPHHLWRIARTVDCCESRRHSLQRWCAPLPSAGKPVTQTLINEMSSIQLLEHNDSLGLYSENFTSWHPVFKSSPSTGGLSQDVLSFSLWRPLSNLLPLMPQSHSLDVGGVDEWVSDVQMTNNISTLVNCVWREWKWVHSFLCRLSNLCVFSTKVKYINHESNRCFNPLHRNRKAGRL